MVLVTIKESATSAMTNQKSLEPLEREQQKKTLSFIHQPKLPLPPLLHNELRQVNGK